MGTVLPATAMVVRIDTLKMDHLAKTEAMKGMWVPEALVTGTGVEGLSVPRIEPTGADLDHMTGPPVAAHPPLNATRALDLASRSSSSVRETD